MQNINELKAKIANPGQVEWIGLRPARREAVTSVDKVTADPQSGLVGDHYRGRQGTRHATLIQAEHLPAIANYLGRESVEPELLRRNIVVSGINLLALKDAMVRVGDAELQLTGLCHPCSLMERVLGEGGYNAVRGHGGVTARVVVGGEIRVGDAVCPI